MAQPVLFLGDDFNNISDGEWFVDSGLTTLNGPTGFGTGILSQYHEQIDINLITNPNFETDTSGWVNYTNGSGASPTLTRTAISDPKVPYGYAATWATPSDNTASEQQLLTSTIAKSIAAGQRIKFLFWVKMLSGYNYLSASVQVNSGSWSSSVVQNLSIADLSQWRKCSIVAPAIYGASVLRVTITQGATGTPTASQFQLTGFHVSNATTDPYVRVQKYIDNSGAVSVRYLKNGTWSSWAGPSVTFGTTAGTAAQGNDSRITGALPASGGTITGDVKSTTAASFWGPRKRTSVGETANYTLVSSDDIISFTTSGITVTLPSGMANREFTLLNNSSGAITLTAGSGANLATGTPTSLPAWNSITIYQSGGGATWYAYNALVPFGTAAGTAAQGNDSRITSAVPNTRKVNGHALSADVNVVSADISDLSATITAALAGAGNMRYRDSYDPTTTDAKAGDFFQYNGSWYVCTADYDASSWSASPSYVGHSGINVSAGAASQIPLPDGCSAGDVVILQYVNNSTSNAVTWPSGFTTLIPPGYSNSTASGILNSVHISQGYISMPVQSSGYPYSVMIYVFHSSGTPVGSNVGSTSSGVSGQTEQGASGNPPVLSWYVPYVAAISGGSSLSSVTVSTEGSGIAVIEDIIQNGSTQALCSSVISASSSNGAVGSYFKFNHSGTTVYYIWGHFYVPQVDVLFYLPINFAEVGSEGRKLLAAWNTQSSISTNTVNSITVTVPPSGKLELSVTASAASYSSSSGLQYGITSTGTDLGYLIQNFDGYAEGRVLLTGLTPGDSQIIYFNTVTGSQNALSIAVYSA